MMQTRMPAPAPAATSLHHTPSTLPPSVAFLTPPLLLPAIPHHPLAGLLHIQTGALGPQLVAVTPLQPGEFAALVASNDSLRQLAWRAAHAWSLPGRPGFGVLELNGGWRVCSLQQLQAAVAAGVRSPAARQASAPAACPPWAWPAAWPGKQTLPAAPQPSCSASASSSSAAIFSAASVVGGTRGACALKRARTAAARQNDGEEVSSAPTAKRRRHRAAVAAAPATPPAPGPLPQFSEGEVALLQSLLGTPATRRCDAAACPSAIVSPLRQ